MNSGKLRRNPPILISHLSDRHTRDTLSPYRHSRNMRNPTNGTKWTT